METLFIFNIYTELRFVFTLRDSWICCVLEDAQICSAFRGHSDYFENFLFYIKGFFKIAAFCSYSIGEIGNYIYKSWFSHSLTLFWASKSIVLCLLTPEPELQFLSAQSDKTQFSISHF